ncbi:MAG: PilX N-terminal domain-containing pilus assembly protein [Pseudomonadota bacterium]
MNKLPQGHALKKQYRPRGPQHQQGAVLLVVLLLLLLTTIVGYQAMETSSLETRMAVAREGKELSFQAVESMIAELKNDAGLLSQAYINALVGGGAASLATPMDFPGDLSGNVDVHFREAMLPKGYAATIGANTLRSIRFELRARVERTDDRFNSEHIQGIKRLTPFVQQ